MKHRVLMVVCGLTTVLTGCADGALRDTLGLNRDAPDEFTVVSRPPLSVPPEFNLLPPKTGAAPLAPSAGEKARGVMLGTEAVPAKDINSITQPTVATAVTPVIVEDAPSEGAQSLLKNAGADKADESIRSTLGEDEKKPADTSAAKTLYEKMLGKDKPDPVVDAKKEAERLRSNKDTGKPASEGDVPVEEQKPKSLIDRIF